MRLVPVFSNSFKPGLNLEGLKLIWKGGSRDDRTQDKVLASVIGVDLSPYSSWGTTYTASHGGPG